MVPVLSMAQATWSRRSAIDRRAANVRALCSRADVSAIIGPSSSSQNRTYALWADRIRCRWVKDVCCRRGICLEKNEARNRSFGSITSQTNCLTEDVIGKPTPSQGRGTVLDAASSSWSVARPSRRRDTPDSGSCRRRAIRRRSRIEKGPLVG